MKLRIASLSLLVLMAVPAMAQIVYDNGPINGNTNAWTINFGFSISDTFSISGGNTTITGISFGAWLSPGDTLTSAEVSLTEYEFGGTVYFDQSVNFTQSGCVGNHYGYDVCDETSTFNGPTFQNGTYWLTLQNASVPSGNPVYWDENGGVGCTSPGCPSSASNNAVGTLPSESFTLLGSSTTTTSTSTTTSIPEPSSIMLLGSGVLGLAGLVRRRLF